LGYSCPRFSQVAQNSLKIHYGEFVDHCKSKGIALNKSKSKNHLIEHSDSSDSLEKTKKRPTVHSRENALLGVPPKLENEITTTSAEIKTDGTDSTNSNNNNEEDKKTKKKSSSKQVTAGSKLGKKLTGTGAANPTKED